jgi:hypothetical protein
MGSMSAAAGARVRWLGGLLTALLLPLTSACDSGSIGRTGSTLEVNPELNFGTVSVGRRKVLQVELKNLGRTPLRLKDVRFEAPAAEDFTLAGSTEGTLDGGGVATLTVSFGPMTVGTRAARLLIPTDSPQTPLATVMLWGEGVLGKADLSPTTLDFGRVEMNTSQSLSLKLENTGKTPAEVQFPAPTGDDPEAFRPDTTGWITVAPKSSLSVPVQFVPSRLGPHAAEIDVQPCPSCDIQKVTLLGEGIAATLVADPTVLDFGHVAPNSSRTMKLRLTNVGSQVIELTNLSFGQGTSTAFSSAPFPSTGVTLNTNDTQEFQVTFLPTELKSYNGTLRIQQRNVNAAVVVIPLKGIGGGAQLEVKPNPLGFPRTGVNIAVDKQLIIQNTGGGDPLSVTKLEIRGDDFSWKLPSGVNLPYSIDSGRQLRLTVSYQSPRARLSSATMVVSSVDKNNQPFPDVEVPLTGSASDLGPCSYEVAPAKLMFGSVAVGQRGTLAFAVTNTGPNDCAIANVRLSLATSPAFALTELSSRLIGPGERFLVPVEFEPDSEADFAGSVLFDMSSPTNPTASVALTGTGGNGCLSIAPTQILFGNVGLMCNPPTRSLMVSNTCIAPVDIARVYIDSNGQPSPFSIPAAQQGALRLSSGAQRQIDVTYAPKVEREDVAPLYVETSLSPAPFLVSLNGDASIEPKQTDVFTQALVTKVDFLFVIDNSGSMADKQDNIAANAKLFLQAATSRNVDFHIGITSTGLSAYDGGWAICPGGGHGGENGRLFPVDNSRPRILTPTTPNLVSVFGENVKVGICHWWEQGLEAARLALSPPLVSSADDPRTTDPSDGNAGFLRSDAKLYVFYVSDANDSDTTAIDVYVNHLKSLKPGRPDLVGVGAAVGLPSCDHIESIDTRYSAVARAFGGTIADICSNDWGALLGKVAQEAFSPTAVFPLSRPGDIASIVVEVDGNEVPASDSGTTTWKYDPAIGSYGAVVFESAKAPGANQTVTITYITKC